MSVRAVPTNLAPDDESARRSGDQEPITTYSTHGSGSME